MSKLPPLKPGEHLHLTEITPERRARVEQACRDLVDWLMAHTQTPLEGMMVLDFVSQGLAKQFDIRARTFVTTDDMKAGQA